MYLSSDMIKDGMPLPSASNVPLITTEIAEFYFGVRGKVNTMICQCEYGEAQSAAVAAAISELESRERLQYFIDEKYFPNKHVFRKVFAILQSVHNLQY